MSGIIRPASTASILESLQRAVDFAIFYVPYTAAVRELAWIVAEEITAEQDSGQHCVTVVNGFDVHAKYEKKDDGYSVTVWVEETLQTNTRGKPITAIIDVCGMNDVRNQLIRLLTSQTLLRADYEDTTGDNDSDSNSGGSGV